MGISLRESLLTVLKDFPGAAKGPFGGSPIAAYVRRDFPMSVRQVVDAIGDYVVQGSPGQGQWVRSPWVAIFDPLITDTAQRGYYPVYLFREDFTGLYLSLNQGVTDIRNRYRAGANAALSARARDFRARIGKLPPRFTDNNIDLRPSGRDNYSAAYEAGNICAVFYDGLNVPNDKQLDDDLISIMKVYSAISNADPELDSPATEGDEPTTGDPFDEDHTRFKAHRRLERNPKVAKAVKAAQGLICKACGFDFRIEYPGINQHDYIEAHHLIPISHLKGQRVRRDPVTDFAVLCANCHRMIHRSPEPWNLVEFQRTLRRR